MGTVDVHAQLKIGARHHRAGRLQAAASAYAIVLQHFPDHPDALHLSGLIAHQLGNSAEGLRRIRLAVRIQPENVVYRRNLCHILFATGNIQEGMTCCRELIGEFPEAVDALALLGNVHLQRAEYRKAYDCLSQAIRLEPENGDLLHNLGVACQELGQLDSAISNYRKSLQVKPDLAEAHYNLGNALRMRYGANAAVLEAYRSALTVRPGYLDAVFNLAKTLDELELIEEAVACYRRTLALAPDLIQAHNDLGNAYLKLGRYPAAADCYMRAVQIDPGFVQGYFNLALAGKLRGTLSQAAGFAKQLLALDPQNGEASSLLVQIYQQACAWDDLQTSGKKLDAVTKRQIETGQCPSEQPFLNFTRHDDPGLNLAIARAWSDAAAARAAKIGGPLNRGRRKTGDGTIVIGYVSERFRNSATAHLAVQLFGLHDRQRFRVHAYSYGKDDGSSYRRRIAEGVDCFTDIRHLNDFDAARRICDDGVDILVDLMGYMHRNRIGIFSFRPAPVQVAYLGYPGTTGADFMDYLIADPVVVPTGEEGFFSECVVRLPHSYQMNDNAGKISAKSFCRKDFSLPEKAFVYCSFNTDYKIDRSTFRSWMSILARVPQSVLWLLVRSPETRRNLIDAATAAGVAADRLIFAESLPKDEHLARVRLADLALDTGLVNGHTTTSDCLWAELPVIALRGKHFASRVSASLLTAIGLEELICDTSDAYESLAVRLAVDRLKLINVRNKLSKNRLVEPLFDSARTVRDLEAAYLHMWTNYMQGLGPQPFKVPA